MTTFTPPQFLGPPATADTPVLSYAQLTAIAEQAGLTHAQALTAAAIALAESGGRPRAFNGNTGTGDTSYGLWQINMIGSLGPARRASLGLASNDQLYDPATNARAMVAISGGGTNWKPWTTFNDGAYKKFLGGGADTSSTGGGVDTSGAVPIGSSTPAPSNETGCLIGDIGVGPATLPCVFYKSWGWAILGASAMVGGSILMTVGLIVAVGRSKTVIGAAAIATKGATGAPAGNQGANTRGRTYRKNGSVRPLQTADEIDENNFNMAQQREVEARTPADRAANRRKARRVVDNPNAARARRSPRRPQPARTLDEEPF